jgi:hypothetical protein
VTVEVNEGVVTVGADEGVVTVGAYEGVATVGSNKTAVMVQVVVQELSRCCGMMRTQAV